MRSSPLALLALVILAACDTIRVESAPATPSTTMVPATTTVPPMTAAPMTAAVPQAATRTVPEPVAPVVLQRGDEGRAVAVLQERLQDLRFWVGPVDGVFGRLTEQAVYAFQKANGLAVDGRVGSETYGALDEGATPTARTGGGRVMEVDASRQLLMAVLDGHVQWVFNTSTGTEEPYQHPGGYTAMADTPRGRHTVYYQFDGWQDGRLGPMYRPKYFHHDGIAVHGSDSVPPRPASHGCVRVTVAAMDHIWATGLMPLHSTVVVYGETPTS